MDEVAMDATALDEDEVGMDATVLDEVAMDGTALDDVAMDATALDELVVAVIEPLFNEGANGTALDEHAVA
eukprot:1468140-Amphidinium_carterae.1